MYNLCCNFIKSHNHILQYFIFFRFPTYNPTIMKKWNAFLLANDKSLNKLTKNSVICSCHFDSSSFIYYKSRRLLSRDAVPCLTVFRVKSVSN